MDGRPWSGSWWVTVILTLAAIIAVSASALTPPGEAAQVIAPGGGSVPSAPSGLKADVAGQALNPFDLPPGGSVTIEFEVIVDDPVSAGTDSVCNQSTMTGSNFPGTLATDDPDLGGATDPTCTLILASPNLAADKLVSDAVSGNNDGMVQLGEVLTYTVTVTNSGNEGAANVVITDGAPPNTTYNDGSASITGAAGATGAAVTTNVGSLQVNVGELASGGFVTVTFTVTFAGSVPAGTTQIDNRAQVAATGIAQFDSTEASIPIEDTVPPTVVAVDTVPPTGGGLTNGEITTVSFSTILVTFSEPVQDSPGSTAPDDVTNPANYQLVEGGTDGVVQTLSCIAGPVGDDAAVPIAGVTYDDPSRTATVNLGGSLPLGSYTFFVCGSTSIVDLGGNSLNGGTDVTIAFQVMSIIDTPTLGPLGVALLVLLLLAAGWWVLRGQGSQRRGAGGATALLLLVLTPAVAPAVVIDDFVDPASPVTIEDPGSYTTTNTAAIGEILGGEREAEIWRFSGASTSASLGGGLSFATPLATTGQIDLVYDGVGSGGLGGADLTAGGATALRLRVDTLGVAGAEVGIELLDTAGNLSIAGRVLPAVAGPTDFYFSFVHDFVPGAGEASAADFTAVDLLSVWLWLDGGAAGDTLVVSLIDTVGPSLAAEKTDLDTTDVPLGATPVVPGTTIRYRVTITNQGGHAAAVDVADVIDGNTTLVGLVRATPMAIDDAYEAYSKTTLQVTAPASGLLGNDRDPDDPPGPSLLAVTAFDARTAKSLSDNVTVAADGTFSYDPPPGFTGVDSFGYTTTDDEGEPASAEVYILVIDDEPSMSYSGGNWTWTPPATILTNQVPNLASCTQMTVTTIGCNSNSTNTIRIYDDASGVRYSAGVTFSAADTPQVRVPLTVSGVASVNYVQNASGASINFTSPGTITFTFHKKGWRRRFF